MDTQMVGKMRSRMSDEQRALVINNIGLAYKVSYKYCGAMISSRNLEHEDIYQMATETLCRAAQTYKPGGAPFGAYAGRCIQNKMLCYRRDHGVRNRLRGGMVLSLDDPLDTEDNATFGEMLEARDENVCELMELIRALPDREQTIVALTVQGYNQCEIGARLGIAQSKVSLAFNRARRKLREAMRCE